MYFPSPAIVQHSKVSLQKKTLVSYRLIILGSDSQGLANMGRTGTNTIDYPLMAVLFGTPLTASCACQFPVSATESNVRHTK
jgi:hypothetical protein